MPTSWAASLWASEVRRSEDRGIPQRTVLAAWVALFLNVLAFAGHATVVPIPDLAGKLITQAALPLALLLALMINPRGVIRSNLFLVLLSALGVVALMVSIHNEFPLGSTFRACRLIGFVIVLWLLTPWWGRRDMLLLRCHRRVLWVVLGTVVVGAVVTPGTAFAFQGRLSGVLWPIPPTQVAHYAAVMLGTSAVLWMCRVISGPHALVAVVVSGPILVATHTRTAALAAVAGIAVAAASLFLGHVRVRRASALGAVLGILGATAFASQLTEWALRGQTVEEAGQFTGRTKVWAAVFDAPRPRLQNMFGSGLSDQSFNGLPVDSNWVAAYLDQGWFGVIVQACVLLLLLAAAASHESGSHRAVALFLVIYCLVASVTETGLGTPSPYWLDLTVAAALLATEVNRRAR